MSRISRRDEAGTGLVELALVLPVLMLLVVGTLDFGRMIYTRNAMANSARDAARFASVDPLNTTCIASVAAARSSLAALTPGDVSVTRPPGAPQVDQPVTVRVRSQYQPITPLIEDVIGTSRLALSASATMRIRSVAPAPLSCP